MKDKKCVECGKTMLDVGNCRQYCKMCAAKRKYVKGIINARENSFYMEMLTEEQKIELREKAFKIAEERIKKELEENPL